MPLNHFGQKPIMLLQRHLHRRRIALPQPGGPLDVGQQERHRPRRQLHPTRFLRVLRRTRHTKADRRVGEALTQQHRKIIDQQPFQLSRRAEGPIRHAPAARIPSNIAVSPGSWSGAGRFRYNSIGLPAASRNSCSKPEISIPGATQPYRCQ
jgi:hypothetical protein